MQPTNKASAAPSAAPSASPSLAPSEIPSTTPSSGPSEVPATTLSATSRGSLSNVHGIEFDGGELVEPQQAGMHDLQVLW